MNGRNLYLRDASAVMPPQMAAVSGTQWNAAEYGDYLEGVAGELPGIRLAQHQAEMVEEDRRRLDEERALARRDTMASLAVSGVDVGSRLRTLARTKPVAATASALPIGTTSEAADTALHVGSTANAATPGVVTPAKGVIGRAVSSPLLPVATGFLAGKAGGKKFTREIGRMGGLVKSKQAQSIVGGTVKGATAGFVTSGFNPLGALIGGITGGASGSCIIVTACCGRNSPEVTVARAYRDTCMDIVTLRGYYRIAEAVVPVLERHAWLRRLTKHVLVDNLVTYGLDVMYGYRPPVWSAIISRLFLGACRLAGVTTPYTLRSNGEVI